MGTLNPATTGLKALAGTQPAVERRHSERRKLILGFDVLLLDQENQPTVPILAQNISTGGISFLSKRPFTNGERFVLLLRSEKGNHKIMLSRTTRCREAKAPWYRVAAQFLDNASQATEELTIPRAWCQAD